MKARELVTKVRRHFACSLLEIVVGGYCWLWEFILVKMLTAESRNFAGLLPSQAEEALPGDNLFKEYPGAAYRGLTFVMLFNLLLISLGALLFGTHIL